MVCDTMWCNLKFWEHEMELCDSPVKVQEAEIIMLLERFRCGLLMIKLCNRIRQSLHDF
jgi:hypothetical protein